MAHFAKLENNTVVDIIVVHNNELLVDGLESEAKGIEFCYSLFGGEWVQTSYNGNFRKNHAGVGYTYDSIRDAFIPPKPENIDGIEFILNEDTCLWEEVAE